MFRKWNTVGIKTKIQVNKDSAGLDTVVEIFGKDFWSKISVFSS